MPQEAHTQHSVYRHGASQHARSLAWKQLRQAQRTNQPPFAMVQTPGLRAQMLLFIKCHLKLAMYFWREGSFEASGTGSSTLTP